MKYISIETTFRNEDEAKKMTNLMLEKRLIACGQISEVVSIYTWDEKQCESKEWLLKLKTRKELFNVCETFIKENHSYKLPQIIFSEIGGSEEYLDWIKENTKGGN